MPNLSPNHKNIEQMTDATRQKWGRRGSLTGICLNAFLFAFKLLAGYLSSSVAIVADAFNNLSDMGSSVVTLLGFKLASRPPDKEHPFGHGRIEYMSAFVVAAAIIFVGVELIKTSFSKIISGENDTVFSTVAVIVLIVSIAVKLGMAFFYGKIGKKIDSTIMKAAATDSISDVISTGAVLLSTVISKATGYNLDAYIGVVVAILITVSGIKIAIETLNPLLGEAPDPDFEQKINDIIMSYDMIIGVHDLVVHDYGPGRTFISVHAEVPDSVDIVVCHDIIDACEKEITEKTSANAVIHMDPVTRPADDSN